MLTQNAGYILWRQNHITVESVEELEENVEFYSREENWSLSKLENIVRDLNRKLKEVTVEKGQGKGHRKQSEFKF